MQELTSYLKTVTALGIVYFVASVFGGSWDPIVWSNPVKVWATIGAVVVYVTT